ncbi:Hypothetical Protein FCC1311_077692 [Hondaea fermentalgiana]|uniref:Ubiquitin-like domain-containing protein n=1 Tax=Hondaea fermentalgiana TaxID=2315210 RepID=A0A2R5GLN6_9STRA|nr:Hypothetical Protein FCC1311_077692 [Hondaea fermentalgiana]|eukprot:GBG31545.1 Hypothetical Protein FCC1311_077692 [Hondaea fermentalgiana]
MAVDDDDTGTAEARAAAAAAAPAITTKIVVKTLDKTLDVQVSPTTTVADLRRVLVRGELREAARDRRVRFIRLGFVMEDDTVLATSVPQEGVVHCVISENTGLEGQGNNPEGQTVPLDMEALFDEDRRIAEILERGGAIDIDDAGNVNTTEFRHGFLGGALAGSLPDTLRQDRRRRSRRRRAATQDQQSEQEGGWVSGFLVAFSFGFIFGFFTLLFVNRLNRSQYVGLMLGITLNFIVSAAGQTPTEGQQGSQRGSLRGSIREITVLDRFGQEHVFNSELEEISGPAVNVAAGQDLEALDDPTK